MNDCPKMPALKGTSPRPKVTRQGYKQEEGKTDQGENLDKGHSIFGVFLHIEPVIDDGCQRTDQGAKSSGIQAVKQGSYVD